MKTKLTLLIALALMLVSCSDSENSITGSFDNVLSGQIVAAGNLSSSEIASQGEVTALAGRPVTGVEVRARGTGVAATSDSSGRFALAGLPSKVELTFKRSDGIDATANVNVQSNPVVVVELQKNSANVLPAGQSKREIEGLITAVSGTEITVNNASTGGPVTAQITPTTVIRHGNTSLTPADLEVDDRVHVRAMINEDGSLTALEIKLQNPADDDNGSKTQQIEGKITAISASEIKVNDASTHGVVTAKITSETKIRKGNQTLKWDDLHVNDRVHVKAKKEGSGLIALEIRLQNPA
jgi:hypothetical protein